jgi:hypothetical protein
VLKGYHMEQAAKSSSTRGYRIYYISPHYTPSVPFVVASLGSRHRAARHEAIKMEAGAMDTVLKFNCTDSLITQSLILKAIHLG